MESGNAGPSSTVTAGVVITIPNNAPATKSISISVNGGTAVVANLSSQAPGCSGNNPLVCTVSVSAPTASDVFAMTTFGGTNGTGSVVASGSVLQKISTSSKTVFITLAGTPKTITLALKTTTPRECDPSANIALYAMVMDGAANVIIGSYGKTVMLTDSDTSGITNLSKSSISDSSPSVKLAYNGHPLKSATISASATGVTSVTNATLKPAQMIYSAGYYDSSVTVFTAKANGDVAPTRTIVGGNTSISNPQDLALDGSCHLDVMNNGTASIVVFSAVANGNVFPLQTIFGSNTMLRTSPFGIAVDAARHMYVANTEGAQILEFAANANGNASPIAIVSGSHTTLSSPQVIAIGPTGKIYEGEGDRVAVFAAGAHGDATPIASITDSVKPFGNLRGLSIDSTGKIYVADIGNENISVFAANANGSSVPIATISGSNTQLNTPVGLSLDYAGNIVVSNFSSSAVVVFPKGSNGNVSPSAIISGSNTQLVGPTGDAI
jgi:6-phosphogluconolactonase (cycloisomerase 2 family)